MYRFATASGEASYTDAPVSEGAEIVLRESRATPVSDLNGGHSPLHSPEPELARLPLEGMVTSGYGVRRDPLGKGLRAHQGIDIGVAEGTEVRAIADGTVSYSGFRSDYGNLVVLDHGGGVVTLYAHNLLNVAAEGQRVAGGEVIAISGASGRSTGPHLHFEVWRGGENITQAYFGGKTDIRSPTTTPRSPVEDDLIRSIIRSDGSILLTNLPVDPSTVER